jgi:hypothetical protein
MIAPPPGVRVWLAAGVMQTTGSRFFVSSTGQCRVVAGQVVDVDGATPHRSLFHATFVPFLVLDHVDIYGSSQPITETLHGNT